VSHCCLLVCVNGMARDVECLGRRVSGVSIASVLSIEMSGALQRHTEYEPKFPFP
jgi:hypothetical protein